MVATEEPTLLAGGDRYVWIGVDDHSVNTKALDGETHESVTRNVIQALLALPHGSHIICLI